MTHAHRTPARRGFTLIEILVTLAIMAILVALGAPALRAFVVQRTVASQAAALADALRTARSEAIKRNQRITICNTQAADAAVKTCASESLNWASGWLIFVDTDGDKALDEGETLLFVQQAFSPTGGLTVPKSKPAITFGPHGLAVANNASFAVLPNLSGAEASNTANTRCVRLAVSGRVRINEGACA